MLFTQHRSTQHWSLVQYGRSFATACDGPFGPIQPSSSLPKVMVAQAVRTCGALVSCTRQNPTVIPIYQNRFPFFFLWLTHIIIYGHISKQVIQKTKKNKKKTPFSSRRCSRSLRASSKRGATAQGTARLRQRWRPKARCHTISLPRLGEQRE